tara:strand:+ start:846 stop:1820 length:975 start_codon:yes stop_codon:yes gene_type:complete
MTTFLQENKKKNAKNFYCKFCDFSTSNKYNFDKHLNTAKHKHTTKYNENTTKLQENAKPGMQFICECGKQYPYRASLHNHKKKCNYINNKVQNKTTNIEELDDNDPSKELVMKLVEENTEIKSLLFKQFETMQAHMCEQQKQMHEQISELIPRVGNNNTINKNRLNINIFLNEQCKDAITMEEFIKKIEVSLGNLLVTQNKGLSEGVSNIFIENMNKLSVYERPLHCTDVKREIVYIKSEENQNTGNWERDDSNIRLKNALKQVTHMQQKSLEKWVAEHPNWETDPKLQEEYMKLVKNCTEDFSDKENKIIKKLCNQTHVNIIE